MQIIDSHCHIKDESSTQQLLESMEKNSIEKFVLISWPFWQSSDNNALLKIKENNAEQTDAKHPPPFSVVGSIKLKNNKKLKADFNILKNLAEQKKIVGIKIYTGYEHFFANDKLCYKLAEICIENKIPLLFHSGDCWSGAERAKIRFSHPIYIDDIAADFPDLNIIICHFGNPWLMDAAEVMYKNKNVYADLSALDTKKPWDKMKKRLEEAIEYGQCSEKFLFGTDFPLFPADVQIKRIKSLPLDREKTFHGNAEKIFGI